MANYLPAVLVAVIVIISATYADIQKRRHAEESLRADVGEQIGRISANIEEKIQNNIFLMQGLVSEISTNTGITQKQFTEFSRRLMANSPELRNVAAAPDMVVKLVYPVAGFERLLGLNYRRNAAQWPAVDRVRREGQTVVTGPIDLVQGGRGLIIRSPVYDTAQGERRFWGVVSGVIVMERLFRDAGVDDKSSILDIAIVDRSQASDAKPFFGTQTVIDRNPVIRVIDFGKERWEIAAVPHGGWNQLPADMTTFRLMLLLAGAMLIVPMIWAGWLMEDRRQHIDRLQDREELLRELSRRLEIALQTSGIGVWEFHPGTGKLFWDERMRSLYDIDPTRTDCTYEDWAGALHPADLEKAQSEFADALSQGGQYTSEFRIITRDGKIRHIRAIGDTLTDTYGTRKIIGVNWNVSDDVEMREALDNARVRAEAQNKALEEARGLMEFNALHDTLTELPNRRFLDQRLAELDGNPVGRTAHAILHVDLDRFKEINDTLGHAAGDAMLKHAARTLSACVAKDDFVARIGGDEFVILSPSNGTGMRHGQLAQSIIEAMRAPILYDGHECRTGVSIGIASQETGLDDLAQTLINADIALYEAKRRGRNRYEYFSDTLRAAVINTKQTADEILRGLEVGEFIAHFQPQFDANTLEIAGVEALVRWNHPTKGQLVPAHFLQTAEMLNVVARIDEIVLDHAMFQFERWQALGLGIPKVSVNISAQRIKDDTLIERLDNLPIQPGKLCFELLESISFDENDQQLVDNIARIKALGIDIEIDDFGTGYASIVSLLKLSPKRLKIDRQLVLPILQSKAQQQLVSSIIDIGLARGMEIIAEGVETMAHAEILRDLGCHALQGYAFAHPMSPNDLITFTQARGWLKDVGPYSRRAIA